MPLTFQAEGWGDAEREVLDLAKRHWEEMPFDESVPLAPALPMYRKCDQSGGLGLVTARDGKKLVGYFVMFLSKHPHYDVMTAAMDVYFLAPEYRTGANGLKLFQETERAMRRRGVELLLATARLDREKNASALFERLGWNAARVVYQKRLE